MKRREFLTLLGSASAAWPLASGAQIAAKIHRVGYLALLPGQDSTVIKQRLNELGYTEGRNLVFDYRSAEGQPTRLAQLAADLIRAKPDVLVAGFGTLTATALQAASTTIPIVFASVGDPVGAGLVKSLSRPGANVTGVTPQGVEIGGKRLQLLEEFAPRAHTIAVLMNPDTPYSLLALKELRTAADARKQRLAVFEIRTAGELPALIEAAVKVRAQGLVTLEDPLLLSIRSQIAAIAAKARLPTIYGNREFVEAGGLLSYGTDRRQLYRRAAELVDKMLKGGRPADTPVEQPTKFELVINVKTARALGITVPATLLARADEVIE